MRRVTQVVLGIMFSTILSLQAKWVILDNMDGLTKGAGINGQTAANGKNWRGHSNSTVASDPTNSDNLVLRVYASYCWASLDAVETLPDGSKGTIFFRIYFSDKKTGNSIGMSEYASPDGGNHNKTAVCWVGGDPGTKNIRSLSVDDKVWYNVWIEYDLTAADPLDDLMYVYVSGGDYSTRTYAGDSSLSADYWAAGESLRSFFAPGASSEWNAYMYFDDIYIDADGLNATNPLEDTQGTVLIVQ